MSNTGKTQKRIDAVFAALKQKKEKALIAFITAGDPDFAVTKDIVLTLEKNGADIIELGIPFSDPMADGPTIQASSERALKNGATLDGVLKTVKEIRKASEIPIVLFGYYNPILSYGLKKFARDARLAGADGALVVDLPPEEAGDFKKELDNVNMDLIFLLTPTSDDERMKLVAKRASGFIYFVSVTGVTGARAALSSGVESHVKKIKRHFTDLPVGVGFGVSTPEQAGQIAHFADGVVVGSAIINIIAKNKKTGDMLNEAGAFVAGLKKGMTHKQG